MEEYKAYYKSPIGNIEIRGNENGISYLGFLDEDCDGDINEIHDCLKECLVQLDEYFSGRRKNFDLKLQIDGTDFQKKVWKELLRIPFGKVVSYKAVADRIENSKAVRAVGGANNKNKIVIIIPCHRVIGANGNLTGYGGGLWRKEWLLRHEGII